MYMRLLQEEEEGQQTLRTKKKESTYIKRKQILVLI